MITYTVAPTKDLNTLLANLNLVLQQISSRLAALDGTSGVPIVPQADINLNGHKVYNAKTDVGDPRSYTTYHDMQAALNNFVQNLPALLTQDETLQKRLKAVINK